MTARRVLLLALAAGSVAVEPAAARAPTPPPSARTVAAVDQVARRHGLAGEVLVARGGTILLDRGYGPIDPAGGAPHRAGERWRLASITKQVTAALLVKAAGARGTSLDAPSVVVGPSRTGPASQPTLRQLLTHHTGYANPDDTPQDAAGVPAFYRGAAPDLSYCWSKPAVPGAAFAYNNCDYLVAGGALTVGDGKAMPIRWPKGLTMAKPGEMGVPGFVGGKPEPRFQLASYGAAGGLMGTARAVFEFDRSLTTGALLPAPALAELWQPEGKGSYQALGQWVFPGTLAGCAKPKRIVQRDGEIYGVQARNFILPDDDLVVIVFTNRSSDDFPLGEVWEGKGFVYDLLSAAACT